MNGNDSPTHTPESGRVLALDPGRRRTGIALSDPTARLASPLETVELPLRQLVGHVRSLIERHAVVKVVIGSPRLPSGDPGEIAELAEEIAVRLQRSSAVEVILWDETLSSWEATQMLGAKGKRARDKGAVDRLAAALILQDYLDHMGARGRQPVERGGEQREPERQDD